MSRIWLTSDLHLGHSNIAGPNVSNWKNGYRNFDNTYQMDKVLIDNINKYVEEDDILYFHGDFVFGGHIKTPDYRNRIICKNIHFIKGNHDKHIDKYSYLFNSVSDYKDITLTDINDKKHPFIMCHYAFRVWLGSHKGFYHTYGHSHGSLESKPNGKSMDVGVDNAFKIFGEYRPFSLEEVVNILNKRDIAFNDHHSSESNAR
jgi:calcineurin-like phosphoesterase family protein